MTLKITSNNFREEVMNSEIPVLVDIWASWCGPCQMMAPVFEELSRDFEGKVKFAKLNVEEEDELASIFGVQGIPVLIMVQKGEEVGRITGFAPKDILKNKIENIIGGLK